jgi:hypothetical protein
MLINHNLTNSAADGDGFYGRTPRDRRASVKGRRNG